jgi:hypothetical protein
MTTLEARDKPTDEWVKHHKGNSVHTKTLPGSGRELETVWQLRYTSRYDVIHEEDILKGDYTACLGTLYAAHRSFRLASKGEIARGEGPRGEDPSELERIYGYLIKAFKRRKSDLRLAVWLSQPLNDGEDVVGLRSMLFRIVPALDELLEKLDDDIHQIRLTLRQYFGHFLSERG